MDDIWNRCLYDDGISYIYIYMLALEFDSKNGYGLKFVSKSI